MTFNKARWGVPLLVSASALLSACGGDSTFSTTPDATAQVPASASASATGFIDYLKLLVASSADMLEPVDTSMVTGPADDTSEPTVIP